MVDNTRSSCRTAARSSAAPRWAALLLGAAIASGFTGAAHATASATLKVLYDFDGKKDGTGGPDSELLLASDGRYYGTSCCGGSKASGTIYSTDLHGKTKVLHTFAFTEGTQPNGALVQGASGLLYGTTAAGAKPKSGTVFSLGLDGAFTVLHTFGGHDGALPGSGLTLAADGFLYGTTTAGGAYGSGTIFRIDVHGANFKLLYSFGATGKDGITPVGQLLQAPSGNLIGTTSSGGTGGGGTIFSLNPANGNFLIVASFSAAGAGPCNARAGLVEGADGWWYGTSAGCGTSGNGTVFRALANGTLQKLHDFAGGGADGADPRARLVQASDGLFYGVTMAGGAANLGVAFRIDGTGSYLALYPFAMADGGHAAAGLVETAPGNFLGAQPEDGAAGHGSTYLLKVH